MIQAEPLHRHHMLRTSGPHPFQFFGIFQRAEEIEVEAVGNAGQAAIEVEKDQTSVDLSQAIGG